VDWVADFFIREADLYARILGDEAMVREGEELAAKLAGYLASRGVGGGRVLDVGCGVGRLSIPLAKLGFKVVGVDISPSFIEQARERAVKEGVGDRVVFVLGDARELSSVAGRYAPFDAILFIYTTIIGYYDYDTDLSILRQSRGLAKPGSILIIDTVDRHYYVKVAGRSIINELGGYLIIQRYEYDEGSARARIQWTYYARGSNGYTLRPIANAQLSIRPYTLGELTELASAAGWRLVEAYSSPWEPYRPGGSLLAIFKPS